MFYIGMIMIMLIASTTGCNTGKNVTPSTPVLDKNTVLIQNYQFQPAEITIQKGETITWINMDSISHTATALSFDSGLIGNGQSYKHAFNEVGTFDYHCTPHPYMTGKIIVKSDSGQ
jgi:plastocyanin